MNKKASAISMGLVFCALEVLALTYSHFTASNTGDPVQKPAGWIIMIVGMGIFGCVPGYIFATIRSKIPIKNLAIAVTVFLFSINLTLSLFFA